MTIQEFIEAAIEGGWDPNNKKQSMIMLQKFGFPIVMDGVMLDPEAWKAVIRNHFKKLGAKRDTMPLKQDINDIAQTWMHNMVTALCNGHTLEEAISTL